VAKILTKNKIDTISLIEKLLNEDLQVDGGKIEENVVKKLLIKRDLFIKLSKRYRTPFYIFDREQFIENIHHLHEGLKKYIPDIHMFYAMKLNNHRFFINEALKSGMGLDVASPKELLTAIKFGCNNILYFCPGKSLEDLHLALKYRDRITVNIDSFSELKKLGELTNNNKEEVKVGIRIFTSKQGLWSKYGIPLEGLSEFWIMTKQKYPHIRLQGIHFHTSRNKDATLYVDTIAQIGKYLKKNFSDEMLEKVKYVDFGGGYEQQDSEGIFPYELPQGKIIKTVSDYFNLNIKFIDRYYVRVALDIDDYARNIGKAIDKYFRPIIKAKYYTEPGRYLCTNAMHILLTIADVKSEKVAIANGGVSMVGWQRFQHEYFPLINLTNPSMTEKEINIFGKLCTTWDLWGYYCYMKNIMEGDLILVPNQGALTYSIAQDWIFSIPQVYKLE